MSHLFSPFTLRTVTIPNRIGVSPMCQYSAIDGSATDWHLVHLGSRAVGGAGMVMVEAASVDPAGRISPQDLGIWKDDHIRPLARIADFLRDHGSVPAIQIAHAGRKASVARPWDGGKPLTVDEGSWPIVGASRRSFDDGYQIPHELTPTEIRDIQGAFKDAAMRADEAGFDILEIHAAHGYLISSFLSPTSNARADSYGGSFENRIRFLTETVEGVRAIWPQDKPLFVRLSCSEWVEGGWRIEDTVEVVRILATMGVDLIDCSSGGNSAAQEIPLGPGYQVPFADAVRNLTGVPTAAVGLISDPSHADEIIRNGRADLVLLGRESLRDPYWPARAARELNHGGGVTVPTQYLRAW